ncbi:RNA 2',3'-cyclic phosphodiesterase [bacterium]|nr:RNA 2',3'-cyclic phosphodiesterase [candidate division CSSED10-310 bacterium]
MAETPAYRLFIAVPVPDAAKRIAAAAFQPPPQVKAAIRLVQPGNMHLTLAFIGDLQVARIPDLTAELDKVPAQPPITLRLDCLGAFPTPRRARIVWAGPTAPPAALMTLQGKVSYALVKAGIRFDRKPFHPHLTIGRVRDSRRIDDLSPLLIGTPIEAAPEFTLDEFHLLRSELLRDGPHYSIVYTRRFT